MKFLYLYIHKVLHSELPECTIIRKKFPSAYIKVIQASPELLTSSDIHEILLFSVLFQYKYFVISYFKLSAVCTLREAQPLRIVGN